MNTSSFTDEQLLNLVNNTIKEETNYTQYDLTGAYIHTNIASRNKIVIHKVVFLFGFDKNRHSVQYQKEISGDVYFIWCKAILLKINSLLISNVGAEYDEINRRMNSRKESNIKKREVIGKEVIGIGKGRANIARTSREKEFSFSLSKKCKYENLSKEYKSKLKAKCLLADGDIGRYEDFITQLEAKGYQYINFYKAYIAWDKEKNYKYFTAQKEPTLGDDWYKIKVGDEYIAINSKSLDMKGGKVEKSNINEDIPDTTRRRDISEVTKCIKKIWFIANTS